MAQYTQTTTFANGNTADGGQVNAEIVALGNAVNNVDSTQLDIPTNVVVSARQGGSASDWNTTGTTTYTPTNPVIQCGTITTNSGEQTSGSFKYATVSVTFPTAYTGKPLVVATQTAISATGTTGVVVGSVTTTGFQVTVLSRDAGYVNGAVVSWVAIGT